MGNAQGRTLLAGLVVAVSAAALTLVGDTLGVTEVWPVLLVAGAGLLVGVPRLRHALALAAGIGGGSVAVWTGAAVLPAVPVGRALAVATGVLLLTVVTVATHGRLRLSMQLVGFAASVAHAGPVAESVVTGGARLLIVLATSAVLLLGAAGLGLLIAQVTQLVASGTLRRGGGGPTAVITGVLVGVLAGVLATPTVASADASDPRGVVEHRQTVVRSHAPDGSVTGGSVLTRVSVSGTGHATVVLRDQAVRGLRSLTGLAGPGPLGERAAPDVVGRSVTHRLDDGTAVRTVAALDRALPVELEVAVTLDGELTTPAAVVGRSGRLSVTYTLVNHTAEPRELRYYDGTGRLRTVTRDVAVPLVGELVVALDDRFRGVGSDDAAVGDRTVRAELVLAAPAGSPVRSITWSADVVDAALPPLQVRLMPLALADTERGDGELARLRRTTDVIRELSDAAGLARTGATALEGLAAVTSTSTDDALATTTLAILEGLIATAATAGAELDEVRALLEAQDARVRAGDGAVHPLLVRDDVTVAASARGADGAPRVATSVVYVLDVAGHGTDAAPGTAVRLLLALTLLIAVGLLGRAIGRLTTADGT